MEPPPVFSVVPDVESIEPTDDPLAYRVTLREPGGERRTAVFRVCTDPPVGASPDWDVFWRWPGDAESIRSVVRRVCDVHRARNAPPQ